MLLKQLAEDIDELDAQLQGKKTTPEVIQAITAKDIAFHTFLCRMSKNPVFERMLPGDYQIGAGFLQPAGSPSV